MSALSGMENSAGVVLRRAVELDASGRYQESLVCYQEGIELLMQVLKATKDDSKKAHYRQKLTTYMDRAEQIKQHVIKEKEEGKYHKQIKIVDNSTGYSYENLFKPYVNEMLTEVWVEDPYIRYVHQLYNFLRFCEMLIKGPSKVKKINLLTSRDEENGKEVQISGLQEIKTSLHDYGVTLEVTFSPSIHDREIRFNNGWMIKIGRGLDYFKKPQEMFSALLAVAAFIGSGSASFCYGNILNVPTTGASCQTAKQDTLPYCGITASERMAETDFRNMENYKTIIQSVASKLCVDAALIAGIISRETRAGGVLTNGWGYDGNGFGLMQVQKAYHTLRGQWNSEEHISQATNILTDMIYAIGRKFPNWSTEQRLKGGIAAYNAGDENISNIDVDSITTGGDYSNDVIARAILFKYLGY